MIEKIQYIRKLGVFDDFNWDNAVKSKSGSDQIFASINIIYGRNYSGKTTLSRIVRALETGALSDKYGSPSFQLKFNDKSDVTTATLSTHGKNIRVFNEGFIRANLRFISNPDDNVEPFVILGDDNNKLEKEIETLKAELGSGIEGQETGLFADKKKTSYKYNADFKKHKKENDELEKKLSEKATNKDIGIKYKSERFGDQNYTITKLKEDIEIVNNSSYQLLNLEQVTQNEKLIDEKVLPEILDIPLPKLSFVDLAQQVETLVTSPISKSDKIQALVKDAALNRWVNDGCTHHRNKHEKCAFCDNHISSERWAVLDKHFDEESDRLEKSIDVLLTKIEAEKENVNTALNIDQSAFYSRFHSQLTTLDFSLKAATKNYQNALDELVKQLKSRKDEILNVKAFSLSANYTESLTQAWKEYINLCSQSNLFSSSLTDEQEKAKKALRLKEVADYLLAIDHQTKIDSIETLKQTRDSAQQTLSGIKTDIKAKQEQIRAKKTVAKQIIERLKQDNEQFSSLMRNVGELVEGQPV